MLKAQLVRASVSPYLGGAFIEMNRTGFVGGPIQRGWSPWDDPASTPRSCVSAQSGWSSTHPCAASTTFAGRSNFRDDARVSVCRMAQRFDGADGLQITDREVRIGSQIKFRQ